MAATQKQLDNAADIIRLLIYLREHYMDRARQIIPKNSLDEKLVSKLVAKSGMCQYHIDGLTRDVVKHTDDMVRFPGAKSGDGSVMVNDPANIGRSIPREIAEKVFNFTAAEDKEFCETFGRLNFEAYIQDQSER